MPFFYEEKEPATNLRSRQLPGLGEGTYILPNGCGYNGMPATVIKSQHDFRGSRYWASPNERFVLIKWKNKYMSIYENYDNEDLGSFLAVRHPNYGGRKWNAGFGEAWLNLLFQMQADGNLVLYDDGCIWFFGNHCWRKAKWSSGTNALNARLMLQGDGHLVIYDQSCTELWRS